MQVDMIISNNNNVLSPYLKEADVLLLQGNEAVDSLLKIFRVYIWMLVWTLIPLTEICGVS